MNITLFTGALDNPYDGKKNPIRMVWSPQIFTSANWLFAWNDKRIDKQKHHGYLLIWSQF